MSEPDHPQLVLFDLDGTLLDTIEDLADSANAVLRRYGFVEHPVDLYNHYVGDGVRMLLRRAVPEDRKEDEELLDRCQEAMAEEYGRRWADKSRPYPGMSDLLDALSERGLPMAVLSNKVHAFTCKIIDTLMERWEFAAVQGAVEGVPLKPDPQSALELAARLNVQPQQVVYLGDTNTDMMTAQAAGMKPVGVTWGFRSADELRSSGARFLIDHPLELLPLLGSAEQ